MYKTDVIPWVVKEQNAGQVRDRSGVDQLNSPCELVNGKNEVWQHGGGIYAQFLERADTISHAMRGTNQQQMRFIT